MGKLCVTTWNCQKEMYFLNNFTTGSIFKFFLPNNYTLTPRFNQLVQNIFSQNTHYVSKLWIHLKQVFPANSYQMILNCWAIVFKWCSIACVYHSDTYICSVGYRPNVLFRLVFYSWVPKFSFWQENIRWHSYVNVYSNVMRNFQQTCSKNCWVFQYWNIIWYC